MRLEIHGRAGCPFAWRVRLAAAEKGIAYTTVWFDTDPPDPGHENNPEHKSPLLWHGDFVLTESMVIATYLDEAFPGPSLSPADPRDRARMRLTMLQLEKLAADARPGAVVSDVVRGRVGGALGALDAALDERPFLGGDSPCLADVQIWPMLAGWFVTLKEPVPEGRVHAYWQRVTARDTYRATRPAWAASAA